MRTAKHPSLPWSISFDPIPHSYIDNENRDYISVTTLVHHFFPEFDTMATAARVAAREGVPVEVIIARWDKKRDDSSEYGTEVHNYAEACVKGHSKPEPTSTLTRMAYDAVNEALVMISRHYDILGAECLVFDPLFRVAGTIDLPLRHKKTRRYCIADWKTNQAIDITPRYPGHGRPPIEHIPDCNGNHYRLQFAEYAEIMRGSGYVPPDTEFSNAIIYIPPMTGHPVWIPMADAPVEARGMLTSWESEFFTPTNQTFGLTVADYLKQPLPAS